MEKRSVSSVSPVATSDSSAHTRRLPLTTEIYAAETSNWRAKLMLGK
jgi:hypothetical protein